VAVVVTDLETARRPRREIAVAGAIDEDAGAHRLPTRLGLDQSAH